MKAKILLTTFLFLVFMLFFSCDTTEPGGDPPKPPGYQEDIPWPSLADSPWPMYHADPQFTGRAKFSTTINGNLAWSFDSANVTGGISINEQSQISFMTGSPGFGMGGFNIISTDGDRLGYYKILIGTLPNTPIFTDNGLAIATSYTNGEVLAFSSDGTLNWKYDNDKYIPSKTINIGKDGTIYFVDTSRTLTALSPNGNFLWDRYIPSMNTGNAGTPISPDGKMLYVRGDGLIGFDLVTRGIAWIYGNYGGFATPIINSQGDIYLLGRPLYSNERPSLSKINTDGELIWEHDWGKSTQQSFPSEPAIDKNGNVYFGYDSVYSVDYNGKLRWKKSLEYGEYLYTPVTCDSDGKIFFVTNYLDQTLVSQYNSEGDLIWRTTQMEEKPGDSPAIGNRLIYVPTYNGKYIYAIR